MDQQRFDRFSRSLATRTTRRQAVRNVGAGGVLGGIGAVLGVKALGAQGPVQTCALPVYAEVYLGPWLGTVYQGTLSLDMNVDGAIDSGAFDTLDGMSYPLVGQATGRGLDLRVDLGNDLLLTLTGTAENDFSLCQGEAAGSFSGPEMGNMGTWITTGPGQLTTPGDPGIEPSATETPAACAAVSCPAGWTMDPVTCECQCPDGLPTCGEVCCAAGAQCVDASTGLCQCPAGTELCGEACVQSCGAGEFLDATTCECQGPCGDVSCSPSQFLNEGTCECEDLPICPAGTVACGSVCANLDNDPENCGSCGHECPTMPTSDESMTPSLCVAGDCCLDTDHLCAADGDCCSGACNFTVEPGVRVCA
ncbi:MAG: hypothetical protein KC438_08955 [Thermomicrobiales bacterium]|nr:hypothetical protein [Thermomicrobiales bacterium]MCO5222711.1 hypothetical protein [Thermomicrobiales bacterium]